VTKLTREAQHTEGRLEDEPPLAWPRRERFAQRGGTR
jgi:hypothetical protein